jgi:hypothetical protein
MADERRGSAEEEDGEEEEEGEEIELDLDVDPDVNPIMAAVLEAAENGDVDALGGLLSQVGQASWASAACMHTRSCDSG